MNCHKHGYKYHRVEAEDLGWNPTSDTYYRCDLDHIHFQSFICKGQEQHRIIVRIK